MTSSLSVASSAPSVRNLPGDGVDNDLGDEALEIAKIAGLQLFDWQADVLRDACTVQAHDTERWAAREVGVVVSRQAGKGSILEVRQLAGLFRFGEQLQVHSAHEFRTCYEHFRRIVGLVENCDLLRKQVKIIRTGAGDQAIELTNGCRLRFIARSRASGRGFSADAVYLDEAFHLSNETMGALMPALSARPNPQVWYTSSAPHESSVVLHSVRARGLAGTDPRLMYVEWANDPDVDPTDHDAWARANPSLGLLVSEDDIAAEQRSLSPEEFARERLGIAEQPHDAGTFGPIPLDVWDSLERATSTFTPSSARVAADFGDLWCEAGVAGITPSGKNHVGTLVANTDRATFVADLADACKTIGVTEITLPKGSPGEALAGNLESAGLTVYLMPPHEQAQAFRALLDATKGDAPMLRHRGDLKIRKALEQAAVKPWGDGGQMWSRRTATGDISPLTTITMALGRLNTAAPAKSEPVFVFT